MMRIAPTLLVLAASLLSAPVAMALNEYGIEGMGVVSTRADEGRATISADGQRIVFARRGEAGWGCGRRAWSTAAGSRRRRCRWRCPARCAIRISAAMAAGCCSPQAARPVGAVLAAIAADGSVGRRKRWQAMVAAMKSAGRH